MAMTRPISEQVKFTQEGAGAVERLASEKLREWVSVKDFGAVGDGVTNDSPAALAMASAVGFIRFTNGGYLCNTATFDVPVLFDPGAYVTVPVAETLTITFSIESTRQWIFRGEGDYVLTNDGDSGEQSRKVHVSWFGALPSSGSEIDQAQFISKCFTAVGNLRESVVDFDIGRYAVGSGLVVPRACHLRGSGTRRTVFDPLADGFSVFTTGGVGVRFSGIQFELPSSFPTTYRSSPWITISHGECNADDVWMGRSAKGIVVRGGNFKASNIFATYSADVGAESSLIQVQSNNCSIDGITAGTSAFGPTALVEVGGSDAPVNVSNIQISNLKWVVPSIGVLLNSTVVSISRVQIDGLAYAGLSGTSIDQIIKTTTAAATSVSEVSINAVTGSSLAVNGILLEQKSSGSTRNITISNVSLGSSSGYGIGFVQTAGSFTNIIVGDTVNVLQRTTPFYFSGSTSDIDIAAAATPGARGAYCYQYTIADDSAVELDFHRSVLSGVLVIAVSFSNHGIYLFRAAPTVLTLTPMTTPSAAMATALTALTGTTGADGKFTVGVQDRKLYLENRLGSSQPVSLNVLAG